MSEELTIKGLKMEVRRQGVKIQSLENIIEHFAKLFDGRISVLETPSVLKGKKTRWVTDGIKSQKIREGEAVPAGWKIGRLKAKIPDDTRQGVLDFL